MMFPYLDMLNHKNPKNVKWHITEPHIQPQGVHLKACADIKKGEELFHSYGNKANRILLMNYGFIIPEN
jgi:histone-lysine N-methyltransferase SETD3